MLPKHPDQMTNEELDQWIRRLVDIAEPEGILLDYKQEIKLNSQGERRESARDITSFANEIGGTLLYGVPEDRSQASPIPTRPYGIDPVPGLEQNLDNIFATTIVPLLAEYRIRKVDLSEYPGMVCYVVWTPESWMGPHMVQGYDDGRYFRRGQYRAVIMPERDVEERYRRRLLMRNAADDFISSDASTRSLNPYNQNHATTTLMMVPLFLTRDRVEFTSPLLRQWLHKEASSHNSLLRDLVSNVWVPSMDGVKSSIDSGIPYKADLEIFRNAAIVLTKYTAISDDNSRQLLAYIDEFRDYLGTLNMAASFYDSIGYHGPLAIRTVISFPPGYTLLLPHSRARLHTFPLDPTYPRIEVSIVSSASDLSSQPHTVLRQLANRVFQAFGLWEADCFDKSGTLSRSSA